MNLNHELALQVRCFRNLIYKYLLKIFKYLTIRDLHSRLHGEDRSMIPPYFLS